MDNKSDKFFADNCYLVIFTALGLVIGLGINHTLLFLVLGAALGFIFDRARDVSNNNNHEDK